MLTQFQYELIEQIAQHANVLVLLGNTPDLNLFFTFTSFDGANRSNIGSVEYNSIRGINITTFMKNNDVLGRPRSTVLSAFNNFIENAPNVVTVKYGGTMPYLIYGQ